MASNLVIGIGGLCRSDTGSWIKGFIAKSQKVYAGTRKQLKSKPWEREEAWKDYIIASDCIQAVTEINSNEESKDQLTRIIKTCRMLLEQDGGTLMHGKREANSPADEMARLARKDSCSFYGIECILTPHLACSKLIRADKSLEPNSDGQNREPVNSIRAMPAN